MQKHNIGWLYGLIGVCIFSGSLPATKLAVVSFDPLFLTAARSVLAAIAGCICLAIYRQLHFHSISRRQLKALILVALGVVIGFPLFTALALKTINASRAIVFIGLLPLMTAFFGVLGSTEKPSRLFWFFSIIGAAIVFGFMLQNASPQHIAVGDLYMIIAIVLCGLGYAEGAKLAKSLGSWQVICWALIISSPLMLILLYQQYPQDWSNIEISALWSLLYVSFFSMLIGFFFWYKALALGGVAQVGQIQLLQPFFGFALSALLLAEPISAAMLSCATVVLLCVGLAKKYS